MEALSKVLSILKISARIQNEYAQDFAQRFYMNLIQKQFGGHEQPWLRQRISAGDFQSVHTYVNQHGRRPDLQKDMVDRVLKNPDIVKNNKKYFDDEE